jgi:hypothetical protein
MAEIVQEPTNDSSGTIGDAWSKIIYLISNYWWVILLFALLIAAIVVIFIVIKKKEENDMRRDSAVYATAMNIRESCEQNNRKEWIRNYYSLWNLLWLGIPFKRNEHSVRIVDMDRNILGWYRGHTKTQGGDIVFLMYKTKWLLGLLEDKFLLYCPVSIHVPKVDKAGNPVMKKGETETTLTNLPDMIKYDTIKGNEIRVQCNTITKQGNYYQFPNYVIMTPNGQEHIDLSYELSHFVSKTNFLVALETGFSDMSKAMGRAAELNPHMRYEQKVPEKEKSIEDNDQQQS